MSDMYTAWKDFFAPAFQQLLDAEMETKLGYSRNEIARTANRFDFINSKYANRVIERIDFISDEIREKLITSI